jgi:hypothetical protein
MSRVARGATQIAETDKKASGCGGAKQPPGPMTIENYDSM